ncbi:TOBE domain-containing protein [Arenibacter sp. M-2]|uniref:TOBE domain-containing protein n=1 Tax=unclassified Arenibacter TaxID=2615047 RepID=UPI000D766A89|nr:MULTISPECIES: TOBE domain-containing protein [unclassified Arenibacter]MDL5513174.1 TOBE domain-containing protein [Arenibacter sp. M-2]|tara:strand:- start:5870 stop:6271 length:402 start_codon:yes stop_codon:yes gene_type:complete
MNSFSGHITDVKTNGTMSVVSVQVDGNVEFISVLLDTPESAPYLKKDRSVKVLFKEMEVAVTTQKDLDISIENRIAGKIVDVEKGVLLSRLTIETKIGQIIAILSTLSAGQMGLAEKMNVMIMVKMNEIILAP